MGRAEGLRAEKLADLPRYASSEHFTALEKQVLDFTVAVSSTPAEVADELRTALRQQLGAAGLAELAATVAWENHRARINRALGVRPMGFSDGGYCAVPETHGSTDGGGPALR